MSRNNWDGSNQLPIIGCPREGLQTLLSFVSVFCAQFKRPTPPFEAVGEKVGGVVFNGRR